MTSNNKPNLQHIANYFLITVAVGMVVTLLAGWVASSRSLSATDKTKLEQTASSLKSYAAESYILAQQYQEGRTTDNYIKISAVKLQYAVSSLNNQLQEQPVKHDVAEQANEVSQQATELQSALSDLSRLPDKQKAAKLAKKIKGIQERVAAIQ